MFGIAWKFCELLGGVGDCWQLFAVRYPGKVLGIVGKGWELLGSVGNCCELVGSVGDLKQLSGNAERLWEVSGIVVICCETLVPYGRLWRALGSL